MNFYRTKKKQTMVWLFEIGSLFSFYGGTIWVSSVTCICTYKMKTIDILCSRLMITIFFVLCRLLYCTVDWHIVTFDKHFFFFSWYHKKIKWKWNRNIAIFRFKSDICWHCFPNFQWVYRKKKKSISLWRISLTMFFLYPFVYFIYFNIIFKSIRQF